MTFTVATWREHNGSDYCWIACAREGFFVAQGKTADSALSSLRLTIMVQLSIDGGNPLRCHLPEDLERYFSGDIQRIDIEPSEDVRRRWLEQKRAADV